MALAMIVTFCPSVPVPQGSQFEAWLAMIVTFCPSAKTTTIDTSTATSHFLTVTPPSGMMVLPTSTRISHDQFRWNVMLFDGNFALTQE
jgi:hypothetical protein